MSDISLFIHHSHSIMIMVLEIEVGRGQKIEQTGENIIDKIRATNIL